MVILGCAWVQVNEMGQEPARMAKHVQRGETAAWLVHVLVHGEDFVGGIFVGIDVDHPA